MGTFCEIFGNTARLKVLEIFLECQESDFPLSFVAEDTGLSRAITYSVCEKLLKEKYIVPTRVIASAQLYKLNVQKLEVKVLIKTMNAIIHMIAEEYQEKEIVVKR